jgi:iron complex transport system substrate-binding protein
MRKTFLQRVALVMVTGAVLAGCGSSTNHASPVDSAGHPVDSAGHPVDSAGHPVDSAGHPVDSAGRPVDATGHPVDAAGRPTVDYDGHPTTQAGTAGTSAASPYPRTITHDKGTTTIPARPQRIVALDASLSEAVVLLKRPLVGGISSEGHVRGFPPYLGGAVKDTAEVGPVENPDLEAVAALNPDLIVSATNRHEALYDQLSKIAPTVFVKTTEPQWQQNITTLGGVLGAEHEAADTTAGYQHRAKEVGDAINTKAGSPTISVVRFLDGPTRLMQKATFIGTILKDAGLARPRSQDVEAVTLDVGEEQIRQADGSHIFVASYSSGTAATQRLERNPLWKRLEGVRSGNVTDVTDEIWTNSLSVQGAQLVLDDLARTFGVDPARPAADKPVTPSAQPAPPSSVQPAPPSVFPSGPPSDDPSDDPAADKPATSSAQPAPPSALPSGPRSDDSSDDPSDDRSDD